MFLSSADIFKINFLKKNFSGIPSECQTVWILIRSDDTSGLIWVQTDCQDYQQTTLVDMYKELTKIEVKWAVVQVESAQLPLGMRCTFSSTFLFSALIFFLRDFVIKTFHCHSPACADSRSRLVMPGGERG